MSQIISEFKAVFNPFTRQLAVLFGDCISNYTFTDLEEWTKISYNGDVEHPNYLHVQLDYDESLQLLFYPRRDGDQSLHEELGTYWYSIEMGKVPDNMKLAFNDEEFDTEYQRFKEVTTNEVEIELGL